MNEPDYQKVYLKNPETRESTFVEERATVISITSISKTEVREDKRSSVIDYILENEEIHFRKKDVVFWSISEATDPPKVQPVGGGIVRV